MIHRSPDASEYDAEAQRLLTIAFLVQGLELELLIATSARADSLGPILDPTAWQRSSHDHRHIAELAGLLRPFQKRSKEVLDDIAAKARAQESA